MRLDGRARRVPLIRWGLAAVLCWLLSGCSLVQPSATPFPSFYALDDQRPIAPAVTAAVQPQPLAQAPTLVVNPTHAAAGFDSPRIVYQREAHRLDYFAHSEWTDPPARMLAPLLVAALQRSGGFRAVVRTPSAATGELRLDSEIVRLQHDFLVRPSQVRFTLRAWLVEEKTRRVLGWREFDATVPAPSEDPQGGVVAANQAVQRVLEQLSTFVAELARGQATPK